jgi:hypothetical protein
MPPQCHQGEAHFTVAPRGRPLAHHQALLESATVDDLRWRQTPYLAQQDSQDGPLPAQHRLQPFEPPRMGVPTGIGAQCGGLSLMGELDACTLR